MNDLFQTVKWFLARSDVEAADRLINESEQAFSSMQHDNINAYMHRCWPSYFGTHDDYAKVYENAGAHEATFDGENMVRVMGQMWRVRAIGDMMAARLQGPAHVLDFGCSRGGQSINLHNWMPDKRFTLVDIDAVSIHQAKGLVNRLARHPHNFFFRVGSDAERMESFANAFDAVMILEVLEHVKDYRLLIENCEAGF